MAVARRRTARIRWRPAGRVASAAGDESSLLQLVREVQQRVRNDAEVVRIVRWLVNAGAVQLPGTYVGRHLLARSAS